MTTTEKVAEGASRNQETFVHLWADGVRKFWGLPTDPKDTKDTKTPSATEMVDNLFNYYEKVLVAQREYTKTWVAASSAIWSASNPAKDAKDSSKKS